jgi:CRP/FNR family transcriptional regulator
MVSLTQKKMQGRVAEVLLYFSDEIFRSDEFEMILSRQELGEMTNMVKESVVRILKELEVSGVISTSSSVIKILDKEKLKEISEKG